MSTNPPRDAATAATQQAQSATNTDMPSFKWLLLGLLFVALCLLALYFSQFNGTWGNQGDFGTFGDFLGGTLNPVLGFATVGLLIWSLKKQGEELALTRQELAETKKETALSRKAMEAQVAHLEEESIKNEYIRQINFTKQKIDLLLSEYYSQTYLTINHTESMFIGEVTYKTLIYKTMKKKDYSAMRIVLSRLIDDDKYNFIYIQRDLQILGVLVGNLFDLSKNKSLLVSQIVEVIDYLAPFNDIFNNTKSTDVLSRMRVCIVESKTE